MCLSFVAIPQRSISWLFFFFGNGFRPGEEREAGGWYLVEQSKHLP